MEKVTQTLKTLEKQAGKLRATAKEFVDCLSKYGLQIYTVI